MSNTEKQPSLQQVQLTRALGENSVYIPGKHILDTKVRTAYLVDLKDDFQNNRIYSLQIPYVLNELSKLSEYTNEMEEMQATLQECVVMSKLFRKHLGEDYRKRVYDYLRLLMKIHYQADGVVGALQLFRQEEPELFIRLGE